MAVARPTSALWPDVELLSGWPEADEDRMRLLAETWRAQAGRFIDAGAFPLGEVEATWTDDAGVAFHDRARAHLNRTNETGNDMAQLGRRADAYADELIALKVRINDIMAAGPPTVWDDTLPDVRASTSRIWPLRSTRRWRGPPAASPG